MIMRIALLVLVALVASTTIGCHNTCRSGCGCSSPGISGGLLGSQRATGRGLLQAHRGGCGCGQAGCGLWDQGSGGCGMAGCGPNGCSSCNGGPHGNHRGLLGIHDGQPGVLAHHHRGQRGPDRIAPLPHGYMQAQMDGSGAPPSGTVAYPYYTTRAPRDFLLNNPPTIGP